MYGLQLRPHKQVIENAKIPKGLSCSWRPWRSRWIEKMFADRSGAIDALKASCCYRYLVLAQCQQVSGVLEFTEVVAAEAGVAGNSTVEVETMGKLAGL